MVNHRKRKKVELNRVRGMKEEWRKKETEKGEEEEEEEEGGGGGQESRR
jgi:hypothetical protein